MTELQRKNIQRILVWLLIPAVAVCAFAFRVQRLEERPMHTDEAVHTIKAGTVLEEGKYVYDPHEYHGPTIYYAALPFIWLSGARTLAETSEWQFRIVPVTFGVGLILLLLILTESLGSWEALCAAILTAISPAMVYYSRYYIQEMLFVFFIFCAIASGWRYTRSGRIGWALMCGASLGLMLATKETSVLSYAAMCFALPPTLVWARLRDGAYPNIRGAVRPWHAVASALVGLIVCISVVSGFFTNPRGGIDIFLTFFNYFHRAGGVGIHDHSWDYYFRILVGGNTAAGPKWNERLIVVMAIVGGATALLRRGSENNLGRFLLFYTVILSAIYAVIPYKTPWCMLGFLHGMILLAGVGFVGVIRFVRHNGLRLIFVAAMAFAAYRLADLSYQSSFRFAADTRNPYVYGHTSTDMLHLVKRIENIARISPDGKNTLIRVITPDPWPLPWYLRAYSRVGYPQDASGNVDAPIVITSQELQPNVESLIHDAYQSEFYGQRPDVLMSVFIKKQLWDAFIKSQSG